MHIDIPLPANSLIRLAEPGVDRNIPVELEPGVQSVMKESMLDRRVGMHEDNNEVAAWVEYRLDGRVVHRSAHVHLKKGLQPLFADAGALG